MFPDITLIDADSIYFRMACALERKDGQSLERGWQKAMRQNIDRMVKNIRRDVGTDNLMIAVKGHGNFRNDIYPEYKANRPTMSDARKEALNYGHDYMVKKHDAVMADGMEADDLVSIWSAECRDADKDYVVAGIDKDLLQIPGNHYNFVKQTHQFVDYDTAHHNLMVQCLTGDSTDNIPGIKGVGPKKAEKFLHGVPATRQWNRVRAVWRSYKAGDPTTSRRLLEMLTSWEEYESIRHEITSKTSVSKQDVSKEQT